MIDVFLQDAESVSGIVTGVPPEGSAPVCMFTHLAISASQSCTQCSSGPSIMQAITYDRTYM